MESVIYLDDFDLIVYTTVCPRTSIIFIAKTNKSSPTEKNKEGDKPKDVNMFANKLLAKLQGHKTCNAPTIAFVPQSGCIVSGEKLHRNICKEKDENPHILNNALGTY